MQEEMNDVVRFGDPRLPARVWRKLVIEDGCWVWTGSLQSGYAVVSWRAGKPRGCGSRLGHRLAFELLVGPIAHGLVVDHLCRNPACMNPAHLEPVTQKENVRRGLVCAASPASRGARPRQHTGRRSDYTPGRSRTKRRWRPPAVNLRACEALAVAFDTLMDYDR
jgi:hypothetical protein